MRAPTGRSILHALAIGALLGLAVLGIGGRVVMRGLAIANGTPREFTTAGTMTVVLLGVGAGVAAAVIHLVLGLALRSRAAWRDAAFVAALGALTLRGLRPVDAQRLLWFVPLMSLFAALYLVAWRAVTRRAALHAGVVALLSALASDLEAQAPARVGTLAGVVVDTSGAPIAGAEVAVRDVPARSRSDSAGAFRLVGVPVGPQLLQVRRLGVAPLIIPITVAEGANPEVEIVLEASALQLPSVTVEEERPRAAVGVIGGSDFTARRKVGIGTFFTRARIDSLRPRRVHDLFRMAQGLGVRYLPDNEVSIVTKRGVMGATSRCEVALYLDGVRVPHTVLTELQVEHVEAIEAYAGPAATPLVFGGTQSSCGAAAIWLKRGR